MRGLSLPPRVGNPLTVIHLLLSRHLRAQTDAPPRRGSQTGTVRLRCSPEEEEVLSEMLSGDLVAVWEVALSDGVFKIEFSHGTTTGKRVVCVNGQVRPCWTC